MSPRGRTRPDRSLEKALLETYDYVGGLDEVGRGALAGPVSVGLAIVARRTDDGFPEGLADSKQLTPRRREALVEPCRAWVLDWAVAHAAPAEIDALGIVGALRLAGRRALAQMAARDHLPGAIILDGRSDWLTEPEPDLLDALGAQPSAGPVEPVAVSVESVESIGEARHSIGDESVLPARLTPAVRMEVKGDARCAVVAAASILAKVERDALMSALPDPGYDWASNKGYASASHVEALARLGASDQHRRSWNLPGVGSFVDAER